jgi:hypothetical protein
MTKRKVAVTPTPEEMREVADLRIPIDNTRYESGWLEANERIRSNRAAALTIAAEYGRDWRTGRRTAVCAASMNTPLWQAAVARNTPATALRSTGDEM